MVTVSMKQRSVIVSVQVVSTHIVMMVSSTCWRKCHRVNIYQVSLQLPQ